MDKKVTSIVCYITIVGWCIAYFAGDKEGAKVHLNQALVITAAQFVIGIIGGILPFPISLILSLVSIALAILELIGFIWALQDKDQELPIVGSIQILK